MLMTIVSNILVSNINVTNINVHFNEQRKSFVNRNIKIEHGPIGWGFFASADIPAGDQLIRIERRDQITISNVTDTLKDEALNWGTKLTIKDQESTDGGVEGPDCLDGLTIFLLLEMEKGTNSSYFNYIQTLPTSHDTGKVEQGQNKALNLLEAMSKLKSGNCI